MYLVIETIRRIEQKGPIKFRYQQFTHFIEIYEEKQRLKDLQSLFIHLIVFNNQVIKKVYLSKTCLTNW